MSIVTTISKSEKTSKGRDNFNFLINLDFSSKKWVEIVGGDFETGPWLQYFVFKSNSKMNAWLTTTAQDF